MIHHKQKITAASAEKDIKTYWVSASLLAFFLFFLLFLAELEPKSTPRDCSETGCRSGLGLLESWWEGCIPEAAGGIALTGTASLTTAVLTSCSWSTVASEQCPTLTATAWVLDLIQCSIGLDMRLMVGTMIAGFEVDS